MFLKNAVRSSGPAGEPFIWTAPAAPVSIHLAPAVISKLGQQIDRAPLSPEGRKVETGGVLLGRVKEIDEHFLVSVERFEPVKSEHLRSASYVLSARDRERLAATLKKFGRREDQQVVGFYRTHTRPGLFLDEYDFAVIRDFFSHPSAVVLAVRPEPDGQHRAGFFFWTEGDMRRESTAREFDFALPGSPAAATQPAAAEPAVSAAHERKGEARVSAVAAVPAAPVPVGLGRAESHGARRRRPVWAAAAAALVLAPLAWFAYRGSIPNDEVRLNAEQAGGAYRITWNRKSSAVTSSPSAVLLVRDGSAERRIELDRTQLTSGSIVYWPASNDVQFRLDLAGGKAETLRAYNAAAPSTPAAAPAPQPEKAKEPEAVPAAQIAPALPVQRPKRVARPVESRSRTREKQPETVHRTRKAEPLPLDAPARAILQVAPKTPPNLDGEAEAKVKVTVGKDGRVERVQLLTRSVDRGVAEAAVSAAMRWRFEPARAGGKPAPGEAIVNFQFRPVK